MSGWVAGCVCSLCTEGALLNHAEETAQAVFPKDTGSFIYDQMARERIAEVREVYIQVPTKLLEQFMKQLKKQLDTLLEASLDASFQELYPTLEKTDSLQTSGARATLFAYADTDPAKAVLDRFKAYFPTLLSVRDYLGSFTSIAESMADKQLQDKVKVASLAVEEQGKTIKEATLLLGSLIAIRGVCRPLEAGPNRKGLAGKVRQCCSQQELRMHPRLAVWVAQLEATGSTTAPGTDDYDKFDGNSMVGSVA